MHNLGSSSRLALGLNWIDLCVQMSRSPTRIVAIFQVGSDNFKYRYGDSGMEVNDKPVYKCSRGVETSPSGYVLWPHCAQDGAWVAREARRDSVQPVKGGKPVFRTQSKDIDDISVPGSIAWQWWNDKEDTWVDFNFCFKTKRV